MQTASSVLFLFLSVLASAALAQETGEIDPFADPANDPLNPQKYIPKDTYAYAGFGAYLAFVAGCVAWSFWYRGRYMLVLMISAVIYAIGLFLRTIFAKDPHNITKFAIMHSLIVLSPCGFIATVYMLLGRLALHLDAGDLLLLKPSIITKIFVTSDIITVLMQGTGGGLSGNDSESTRNLGSKIFLAGFICQCVSFVCYLCIFGLFVYRVITTRPEQWKARPHGRFRHFSILIYTMAFACQGILIRTIYRTIEASQGFDGHLATSETWFYMLDVLMLLNAMVGFLVVWPPMYLRDELKIHPLGMSQLELQTPSPSELKV